MSRAGTPGLLPAAPADPLHILPPESLLLLLAAAGILVLLLAWLVLRRLFRRDRKPAPTPPPVPRPVPAGTPAISIATRIKALERKFLESKAFREGCHALAAVVKSHLGQSTGLDVERMTSPEIARALEDERIGRFMASLSRRRYGRKEPRQYDLQSACHRAREILT